jgi:hypothetical protein
MATPTCISYFNLFKYITHWTATKVCSCNSTVLKKETSVEEDCTSPLSSSDGIQRAEYTDIVTNLANVHPPSINLTVHTQTEFHLLQLAHFPVWLMIHLHSKCFHFMTAQLFLWYPCSFHCHYQSNHHLDLRKCYKISTITSKASSYTPCNHCLKMSFFSIIHRQNIFLGSSYKKYMSFKCVATLCRYRPLHNSIPIKYLTTTTNK